NYSGKALDAEAKFEMMIRNAVKTWSINPALWVPAAIYTTYMWIICKKRYCFVPEKTFYTVSLVAFVLVYTQALVVNFEISNYVIPSILSVIAILFSYIVLSKRLKA
ncbi:MAG: hypothetical protein IKB57_07585, partial [Bacteroidaceae bacterium]|nr:hypothetical protein [Bacteroidaceae bacterium]